MRCVRCDLAVSNIWRWCPECGGEVIQEPVGTDPAADAANSPRMVPVRGLHHLVPAVRSPWPLPVE
jgi:hypothetical protein